MLIVFRQGGAQQTDGVHVQDKVIGRRVDFSVIEPAEAGFSRRGYFHGDGFFLHFRLGGKGDSVFSRDFPVLLPGGILVHLNDEFQAEDRFFQGFARLRICVGKP